MSVLYYAADSGNLELVRILVKLRDKDKAGGSDRTPLWAASRKGHLTVVTFLVEQGADVEKADNSGWTPLIVASIYGRLEVVRYLLENGANIDKATDLGKTPLHYAVQYGHLETAKLLMVYGADLNARTDSGLLPIDMGPLGNEEIKQAIRDEPKRRIDHGHKRATELGWFTWKWRGI